MEQLPEDLIFSIFLYCPKTSDVANLLQLNRHWLGVARFEALWRMRFAFHLSDRIKSEEERLADNQQALSTSRSKGHIKKLKTLSRSHIDEAEKLYNREKVCSQDQDGDTTDDEQKGIDFYTGFRFYTIFKKEVEGLRIGKMTEKLIDLMSCSYERAFYEVTDDNILTDENPMKKKWKQFIDFVDSNLIPNSESLITDQYYMLQKNCTAQFATKFEVDFNSMVKKLRQYFFKRKENPKQELYQEFDKAVASLIEPIRILTDLSKYKYPIDAYKCIPLSIESMNFDLIRSLLDSIKKDRNRPEEERQYREISVKKGDALDFCMKLMEPLVRKSFPPENIMYVLSAMVDLFPSMIVDLKKRNSNHSKFKCDEDLLANSTIYTRYYYSSMELSMDLFEKAVRDWGYPTDGSSFVAKILYNIDNVCRVSDFTSSLRRDEAIDTEKLIKLIELHEDVSGEKCDDECAYLCATCTSNIELCKYFTDKRGLSLEKKIVSGMYPLPYGFLNYLYPSTYDLMNKMDYLLDRLTDFFNYAVADIVRTDPLHRLLYTITYSDANFEENHEKYFRILRKMLDRKPDITRQVDGVSVQDIIRDYAETSLPIQKAAEIIEEYQTKWQTEE